MKKRLFNLFPLWFRNLPYSDKIAHAILFTCFYLILSFIFPNHKHINLLLTVVFAITVEIIDGHKKGNSASLSDLFWSVIIPVLIYAFFN